MNVGSLFSGIGGIELGFERQGFNTKWFIECDPYAKEIIRKRFPEAKIYGDIKEVDFKAIPQVEVLTGGFPCQDISNAGKRAGIEGDRSSLWKYYLKAISEIRPKIAFIENVSALLGRGLNTLLCDLAKVGYDAEWYCVSASSVGANHQRDRIFILAYSSSNGDDTQELSVIRKSYENTQKRENNPSKVGRFGSLGEIPNTNKKRLQRINESEQGSRQSEKTFRWGSRWDVEPNLGRVANGVSNRVDRIKCCGNAVVPQVAEVFAEAIKVREEGKMTNSKESEGEPK